MLKAPAVCAREKPALVRIDAELRVFLDLGGCGGIEYIKTSIFSDNGLDFNRMYLAPNLRMNAASRVFSVQGMPTIYGIDDSGIISAFDAVSLSSSQFTNPVQTENWQTYVDGQWVPLPFGPSRKKFLPAGNAEHPALIMQDRQKFEAFRANNSNIRVRMSRCRCLSQCFMDQNL